MQETQRALTHATKEVDVLRHSTSDQQDRLSSLSDNLQQVKKEYEGLQQKYTELNNDVSDTGEVCINQAVYSVSDMSLHASTHSSPIPG